MGRVGATEDNATDRAGEVPAAVASARPSYGKGGNGARGTPSTSGGPCLSAAAPFAPPHRSLPHANGKIVEHWTNSDQLGILKQLGVIPAG